MTSRAPLTAITVFVFFCSFGCATPRRDNLEDWISAQGGLIESRDTARVRAAVQPLLGTSSPKTPTIDLLASPNPGAYAWPTRRIFVTRGLLEIVDDAELTAAIAHELGHLLTETVPHPPAAIHGHAHDAALEEECLADDRAVTLLRAANLDPATLPRMLRKLHAHPRLPADCRNSLQTRIRRLDAK